MKISGARIFIISMKTDNSRGRTRFMREKRVPSQETSTFKGIYLKCKKKRRDKREVKKIFLKLKKRYL